MARLILFNKPFGVLSQFTSEPPQQNLAQFIAQAGFYAAGRLDKDSEGLLLLTDDGKLQQHLSDPKFNKSKVYLAQLEGDISDQAIDRLQKGVELRDGLTRPAQACRIEEPELWPRDPPIRQRQHIPTCWIELVISEGRNRQVRRMTAAVGYPTLRLVRTQVAQWKLLGLQPGELHTVETDKAQG